jgi:polysaccharide export outer membrane protein
MKGKVANEPHVSVDIASYAPYYVYGEVKSAGELEYHVGLTVADAVAAAGGLTYRADAHRIYLRRAGAISEQLVALDAPVRIYPGDNLRVAESFF